MTETELETAIAAAARRFSPPVSPPVLAGADISYVVEDVAVGRTLLAARRDGTLLTSVYVPDDAEADAVLARLARRVSPGVLRGGNALDPARRQLDEYLAGRRQTFELATDTVLATPF